MAGTSPAMTRVDLALLSPPHHSISLHMLTRGLLIVLIAGALLIPARAAEEAPAPFDGQLMRLSEILGGLHYLRGLCNPNEGQKWRNEMQALLDAEAPAGSARRAQMMASFNRGYRGFQQAYRTCTPAAGLAIRRYLDEGAKISRDVTARYAN
jgi:uncharacterized protein (TIGR02301 family)